MLGDDLLQLLGFGVILAERHDFRYGTRLETSLIDQLFQHIGVRGPPVR